MPISNGMNLARLLGSSTNIRSQYVAASVSTLADMDALIAETGMTTGDQAYVQENNKLYLYNGAGWYLVATVENAQPTTISGVESSYSLASDGTATTITAISNDPEGFPLTWSYAITTGSLGSTATVSQTDNVFTVTPSTDTANAGEFSITFSVTDGSTGVVSAVSAFTLSFGVDISQATYDNVKFSVGGQDHTPFGITFNPDGTKMYMCGWEYDSVYQYSLSTAFDLSTVSYDSVSFSVASQDTAPVGITFSPDGTQMYMMGLVNSKIFQYSLSIAFDLSTASYSNIEFLTTGVDNDIKDIVFNPAGTKMYLVGDINDSIYQFSLSMAYNVGTASYDNVSFSVASQTASAMKMTFSPDGTQLFVHEQSRIIYQYNLSTAYDISTALYSDKSLNLLFGGASNQVHFNTDATKMYILRADRFGAVDPGLYVYQYSTGL